MKIKSLRMRIRSLQMKNLADKALQTKIKIAVDDRTLRMKRLADTTQKINTADNDKFVDGKACG
jgi:hypothetical protein